MRRLARGGAPRVPQTSAAGFATTPPRPAPALQGAAASSPLPSRHRRSGPAPSRRRSRLRSRRGPRTPILHPTPLPSETLRPGEEIARDPRPDPVLPAMYPHDQPLSPPLHRDAIKEHHHRAQTIQRTPRPAGRANPPVVSNLGSELVLVLFVSAEKIDAIHLQPRPVFDHGQEQADSRSALRAGGLVVETRQVVVES